MEKVTRDLEVGLTKDSSRVEIVQRNAKLNSGGASSIALLPRHARYLANLLVDYATEAEKTYPDRDANFLSG